MTSAGREGPWYFVVFRVDASQRIGTGHIVRCLTLADALRAQGVHCVFLHREHTGHMARAICARGHEVRLLPPPLEPHEATADSNYAAWLGVPPSMDVEQSRAALADQRPDWVLVDHYGLDAEWEAQLRSHAGRIAVLDDLANRPHDADLLVDPNYSKAGARRYDGLLPADAERLCGPRYALLDPIYADYQRTLPEHPGKVERALVFFGGTDPEDLTGRTLAAFGNPALCEIQVDIVVGTNNPHRSTLEACAAQRPGAMIHGPQPCLADLMATADLAVGAGGSTTWERCCLGRPSLVVSIAENQRSACEALAADGIIAYSGHVDSVDASMLMTDLRALANEPQRLKMLSEAGRSLVDGQGSGRVVEALLAEQEKVAESTKNGRSCR